MTPKSLTFEFGCPLQTTSTYDNAEATTLKKFYQPSFSHISSKTL